MIMQSIESILFSENEETTPYKRSLKSLLKPLKHVKIVPRVTSQHGMHGSQDVKGAIEFDISDSLRAVVQNNLNFSESPHIEVEYTLSDDVSVKGVKDERGGLEAEVEMKWTF
jgi:hypothetical protein